MQTVQVKVVQKIKETQSSVTLVLEPEHSEIQYQAGQFLTFIFDDLGPKEIRRSYSFSSTPDVDSHWAITVKKQVNGLVSKYLTDIVQVGDSLTTLLPAGQFTLPSVTANRDVFLIGGGSGITPFFNDLGLF